MKTNYHRGGPGRGPGRGPGGGGHHRRHRGVRRGGCLLPVLVVIGVTVALFFGLLV